MSETIVILDFGSQYSQLITRRVREAQVYAVLLPWDATEAEVDALDPKGFILSGGPYSVYERRAPALPEFVLGSGLPILGICYGMQVLTHALGAKVSAAKAREYGTADLQIVASSPLLKETDSPQVWMSHGDRIDSLPEGFQVLAKTANSPIAAMGNKVLQYYGLQFHPEVQHTISGRKVLKRFVWDVCGCSGDWTPESIIQDAVSHIQEQVRGDSVLAAVSGGVDSSVAAALVRKAVGDSLTAVFVDTGLMRDGEAHWIASIFRQRFGDKFIVINAEEEFFTKLAGVTEPEEKRNIIGETFIRIFENAAKEIGVPSFLVQGTIYPDVIESSAPERGHAHRIKTHHNVGGLPSEMDFQLVEPLRYLFKDEVRKVGQTLGLPADLVQRQPFPGPGLAVRCLGEVTRDRVEKLRKADAIFVDEMEATGWLYHPGRDPSSKVGAAQAFAVLLPVKSVGVMGDQRTYEEVIALRAVTTDDFMTADWAHLPPSLLSRTANRIVNEVPGINRVVYDITTKPPGTIEWE